MYIGGQTLLQDDERDGLLIPSITSRGELDEFEQQNIEYAIGWTLERNFSLEEILTEVFVRKVHRKMFDKVWKWAGAFRKTNKNIGVDKFSISVSIRCLLDDCKFWITHKNICPR